MATMAAAALVKYRAADSEGRLRIRQELATTRENAIISLDARLAREVDQLIRRLDSFDMRSASVKQSKGKKS